MRNLSNIEKSAFRPGDYVGYRNGAWKVWQSPSDGRWHALNDDLTKHFSAKTLAEVNNYFAANNGKTDAN